MLKQIAILTLVLLARSTFAAEIQPTRSLFGIEAIKVQLNAGLDNSGRGEGVLGRRSIPLLNSSPRPILILQGAIQTLCIWSLIMSCLAGLVMRLSCRRRDLMKFHPTHPIQFIRRYGVRQLKSISTAVLRASLSE